MIQNKISKIITLKIIFSLVACISTTVFADNQIDLEALTGNQTGNTTENNSTDEDVPSLDDTITNPGTTPDETPDTTPDTTPEPEAKPENKPTGNTSTYEESDIPYAGPAETMLMTLAFIIFGIIGVYTFVKMSDYSNI